MPRFILSEEYDKIAFLRFSQDEPVDSSLLDNCLQEARLHPWRFIIADFASIDVGDGILRQILDFVRNSEAKYYGKLCFVAQNKNTEEKIKNAGSGVFLKSFRNIGDAINYFYWESCKVRDVIRMKMPSAIGLVPSVRACISDFFALCKIEGKEAFQTEMIIDELCNNAIEHGTQDANKTIEVLCSVNEDEIEINVYNGYSVRAVKEKDAHDIEKDMEKWALSPNREDDAFRGRGLGLVRNFSDSYEINSSTDGTWVHVIKKKKGGINANAN